MYAILCFTNWTGIVAEVKRGQLNGELEGVGGGGGGGGVAEKELAGGLGL